MTQIQIRRDTSTNWSTNNPTPASGEPCYEIDTGKFKIGNGTTPYNNLEYIGAGDLPDNITTQGNTFNNANQLVQLDNSGKLPAVDGSQLTNLPSATPSNMVTTDTNQNITGSKKFTGTYPNQTSTAGFNFPNSTAAEIRISPNGSDHSLFGVTNNTLYIQPGYTVEHFYINNYKDDSSESGIASTVEIAGILYNKLNNVKSKILTTADNGTIANLGMPSMSAFTDETLPASGTATTATEPGYLYIDKTAVAVGEYIQVTVSDSSSNVVYSDDKYAVVADQALKLMVPIPNGCSYTVSYTATGTTNNYRFIKTTGQNA